MSDLADAIRELRRPFTPQSVKWKIQTNPKDGKQGLIVAFMDSRLAAERLNAVVPGDWSDMYSPAVIGNGIVCHLTVCGATRADAGFVESDKLNTDMGLKGLYSDAFKRAAVKFGIGAFLYALPRMYVKADQLTQRGRSWYIPDGTEKMLRQRYVAWLSSDVAKERFGTPLDHGDHEDAQGDPDAVVEPEPAPAQPAVQMFDKAQAAKLVTDIKDLGVDPRQVRMWLVSVGAEDVPSDGPLSPVVRGLGGEQGERLRVLVDEAIESRMGTAA